MTHGENEPGYAFQDYYADDYAHCFGCGRLNEKGLQIKSHWDGEQTVCRVNPQDYYSGGMKDIMYGGLIASLIDCHGAGTAAAAKAKELNLELVKGNMPRFVTATLKVNYLAPTPVGKEVELRGDIKSIAGRKVVVEVKLSVENKICVLGEGLFIQLKD